MQVPPIDARIAFDRTQGAEAALAHDAGDITSPAYSYGSAHDYQRPRDSLVSSSSDQGSSGSERSDGTKTAVTTPDSTHYLPLVKERDVGIQESHAEGETSAYGANLGQSQDTRRLMFSEYGNLIDPNSQQTMEDRLHGPKRELFDGSKDAEHGDAVLASTSRTPPNRQGNHAYSRSSSVISPYEPLPGSFGSAQSSNNFWSHRLHTGVWLGAASEGPSSMAIPGVPQPAPTSPEGAMPNPGPTSKRYTVPARPKPGRPKSTVEPSTKRQLQNREAQQRNRDKKRKLQDETRAENEKAQRTIEELKRALAQAKAQGFHHPALQEHGVSPAASPASDAPDNQARPPRVSPGKAILQPAPPVASTADRVVQRHQSVNIIPGASLIERSKSQAAHHRQLSLPGPPQILPRELVPTVLDPNVTLVNHSGPAFQGTALPLSQPLQQPSMVVPHSPVSYPAMSGYSQNNIPAVAGQYLPGLFMPPTAAGFNHQFLPSGSQFNFMHNSPVALQPPSLPQYATRSHRGRPDSLRGSRRRTLDMIDSTGEDAALKRPQVDSAQVLAPSGAKDRCDNCTQETCLCVDSFVQDPLDANTSDHGPPPIDFTTARRAAAANEPASPQGQQVSSENAEKSEKAADQNAQDPSVEPPSHTQNSPHEHSTTSESNARNVMGISSLLSTPSARDEPNYGVELGYRVPDLEAYRLTSRRAVYNDCPKPNVSSVRETLRRHPSDVEVDAMFALKSLSGKRD